MKSHLVDLLSGLDLTDKIGKSDNLSDLLRLKVEAGDRIAAGAIELQEEMEWRRGALIANLATRHLPPLSVAPFLGTSGAP